jgi:hypothetical protein
LESSARSGERAASIFATAVSRRNRSFRLLVHKSPVGASAAAGCARCLYPESAPL